MAELCCTQRCKLLGIDLLDQARCLGPDPLVHKHLVHAVLEYMACEAVRPVNFHIRDYVISFILVSFTL